MVALALSASVLLWGCGNEEDGGTAAAAGATPEAGGTLRIAAAGAIESLDPLLAARRGERLAARQIYEPLVSQESGPFGQTRRRPGLVPSLEPSAGGTIWTARLRPGVHFSDGEPLDADAVLANASRWMQEPAGAALLPELRAVDSPRPGLVRFQLDRPTPDFPDELEHGELGLVAPDAMIAGGAALRPNAAGTGPFELRESEPGRTLLARNASWWGSRLGLGPGVDQIELTEVDDRRSRGEQLENGAVELADDLGAPIARTVAEDPLLTVVGNAGALLGVERSVRGVESAADDQPLADVWLTDLR
ncbi:MAG: hypothetical protein H0V25_04975 [Solirubrobacterales bacterium]|nr:hypothetical protein [Solirubrobacterales bacterium]